jgi:hypothetical protein
MCLPNSGILEMLEEYKADHGLKFDAARMSDLLSEYTSGYPFLVSRLCSIIHSKLLKTEMFADLDAAWTREGFLAALQILKSDRSVSLFQSLSMQIIENKKLGTLLKTIIYSSEPVEFYPDSLAEEAIMHGFISIAKDRSLGIANRIFETWLHTYLKVDDFGVRRASGMIDFIKNGRIDMEMVFERFSLQYFTWFVGGDRLTIEDNARLFFMAFLMPIINGVGFCHVEPMTRDKTKTDLVIDYNSQQEIVELKIWHGEQYNNEGLEQLAEYLDIVGHDHGYLLVFSNLLEREVKGRSEAVVKGKRIVTYVV